MIGLLKIVNPITRSTYSKIVSICSQSKLVNHLDSHKWLLIYNCKLIHEKILIGSVLYYIFTLHLFVYNS